jgi:aspartyl-tRNA(Asn)/glutamyl-tRNA(Gln) amidotransferase subunit B
MANYELKWSDGRRDSKGNIVIAPGYVYAPVEENEDPSLQKFLLEVESYIDFEFERRLAKAVLKWFDLIRAHMNDNGISDTESPQTFIDAKKLKDLAVYVEFTDLLDFSTAKGKVFPELIDNFSEETTWEIIEKLGVLEKTESNEIEVLIEDVFDKYPDKVLEHRSGKKNLVGLFMGEIMRSGKVKANPKELSELIRKKLET